MSDQTPPKVSTGQLAKFNQVVQDKIRKNNVDEAAFQYILGHTQFSSILDQIFRELPAEYRQCLPLLERPVWKTIQLGTHADKQALLQAVKAETCFEIDSCALNMLFQTNVAAEPEEANLYILSGEDLGFPVSATLQQLHNKAIGIGFELCPAEVGPQLRLQYHHYEQWQKEVLRVAMVPIKVSAGRLKLYTIGRDYDHAWLSSEDGDFGNYWPARDRWVFRRK